MAFRKRNDLHARHIIIMKYTIPRPEGFIVDELPGSYKPGDCTHFTLKKTNWNTIDAIKELAKRLHTNPERFGYSGLKDKNAITTQRVSAWRVPIKKLQALKIKGIELSDFNESLERITIGSHEGNKFKITLEGINKLKEPFNVPNYFGSQRFGKNEQLGEYLIKKKFKKATELLLENPSGFYESLVNKYLKKNPTNYVNALRQVDKKIRALWINAYQAKEWNDKVSKLIKESKIFQKLSLTSYPEIPEMPELGKFIGGEREVIMQIKNYKVTELPNKIILEFTLSKGSYATTLIEFITGNLNY